MHFLQDRGHAMLSTLFLSHLGELALRDSSLLISLFQLLMGQEVLCHDTRDLLEVVEDCKASILYFLLSRAKSAELVTPTERCMWIGLSNEVEKKVKIDLKRILIAWI